MPVSGAIPKTGNQIHRTPPPPPPCVTSPITPPRVTAPTTAGAHGFSPSSGILMQGQQNAKLPTLLNQKAPAIPPHGIAGLNAANQALLAQTSPSATSTTSQYSFFHQTPPAFSQARHPQGVHMSTPTLNHANQPQLMQPNNTINYVVQNKNIKIPTFSAIEGESWFYKFEKFCKCYGMGPDEQYNTMLQSLPDRLVILVGEKVNHSINFTNRYQDAKAVIIERLKKENPDNLDLFENLKKREDVSYMDYLRHIKRLAASESLGENQVRKKFRSGFNAQQIANVEILLNQHDSLEDVAEIMDNISRRQEQRQICAVSAKMQNNTKVEKQVQSGNIVNHNSNRFDQIEQQLDAVVNKMAENLSKLNAKIDEIGRQGRFTNRNQDQSVMRDGRSQQNNNWREPDNSKYNAHDSYRYNDRTYRNQQYGPVSRGRGGYANNYSSSPKLTGANNVPRTVSFQENDTSHTCYFHSKFGKNAYRCEPTCRFYLTMQGSQAKNELGVSRQ